MKYIYILILLFLLLICLCNNKIYENFISDDLFLSNHFSQYMDIIPSNIYQYKINYECDDFKSEYKKNIFNLSNKYKNFLNMHTKKCDKILCFNNLKNLNLYPWKFKLSKNIEMGMPYTLGSYIIFNQEYLDNLLDNKINKNLLNTLIHEKLHVIQRSNPKQFNIFYRNNYKFLGRKILLKDVPNNILNKYMINPDSNFDFWLYNIDGKEYYPILDCNINEVAYDKNHNKLNLNEFKNRLNYNNHISFYHPNEIFACDASHQIMNNNLDNNYKVFLLLL
tara:strand:+ start:2711 stop:3547 length:837 start_codon:yes stop_codon:yes gene_type:complete